MFWLEFVLIMMLTVSIPFWDIIIPTNPGKMACISPVVLAVFFIAASLNLVGLLLSAPRLRRLPRYVWSGWTFAHKEILAI